MNDSAKLLFVAALVACAGCTRASDARREHILAGPHGWIDVTVHAPKDAAPAGAARRTPGQAQCAMQFLVNGEVLLDEAGDLAQADTAKNPLGYRFAVPAGTLNTELALSRCVKDLRLPLPVTLDKNHLALLEFDGQRLRVAATEPWEPSTLDAVHGDVAKLQARSQADEGTLAALRKLGIACVLLNVAVLAAVFLRRR
jgi:hypothetical protein